MKRKQWPEESMLSAMKAVEDGEKVSTAAKSFGVPRITLHDRVTGRIPHGKKPGPDPYLTTEEETELRDFLIETSDYGYGRTRREVKKIVYDTCKLKEEAKQKRYLGVTKYPMGGSQSSYNDMMLFLHYKGILQLLFAWTVLIQKIK